MTTSPIGRVGDYIREQREAAALSVRRLAADSGVSNPYLSQIERGLRKPSAEVLQQIAKALRISAEQLYVRAGLLEDHATPATVETAIVGDLTISERQKRVLLDIYASFRAENATAHTAEAIVSSPAKPKRHDVSAAKPAAKRRPVTPGGTTSATTNPTTPKSSTPTAHSASHPPRTARTSRTTKKG